MHRAQAPVIPYHRSQIQMTSVCLTELKKAEEELRESEGRYRAVVEQAAEGIVLFDVDSKRVLEANVACQNLLGYTPEAILRLTLYDLGPYSRELSTNFAYLCGITEGDRRSSNPRPSEPTVRCDLLQSVSIRQVFRLACRVHRRSEVRISKY
jgi:PAS domain-containing protein